MALCLTLRRRQRILIAAWLSAILPAVAAAELPLLRIGLLHFGTVSWEADVMTRHRLDRRHGFRLEVLRLGSRNATAVALQAGAVDMIVTDYVWAAHRRGGGADLAFYPHSAATGNLMVRADSGIDGLADLAGRRLGIAGGPLDKNWLLLQAHYRRQFGRDLELEPTFAAPPLLNRLIERAELPAVLNFWHYSARLEARGMKPLLSMAAVARSLGVERPVALLGWVFDRPWGEANAGLVNAFFAASKAAKTILRTSDEEWERLRPATRAESDLMLDRLREAYRAGIPTGFGAADRAAAARLYRLFAAQGGERLVGGVLELPPGLFWTRADF